MNTKHCAKRPGHHLAPRLNLSC